MTSRIAFVWLALVLSAAPVCAQSQPVVFVHGLWGTSSDWNYLAPSLQSRLYLTPLRPTLGWQSTYSDQAVTLHSALAAYGSVPAVAHSNGGVTARRYRQQYGASSHLNNLVTVGSLHWGAPLADNVLDNHVSNWMAYVAGTLFSSVQYYAQHDPSFPDIFYPIAQVAGAFVDGFSLMTNVLASVYGYAPSWLNPWPIGNEMRTDSPVFASLNTSSNLSAEASALPARVSIATWASWRRVPFALFSDDPERWEAGRAVLMAFTLAMYYYYSEHTEFDLWSNAEM